MTSWNNIREYYQFLLKSILKVKLNNTRPKHVSNAICVGIFIKHLAIHWFPTDVSSEQKLGCLGYSSIHFYKGFCRILLLLITFGIIILQSLLWEKDKNKVVVSTILVLFTVNIWGLIPNLTCAYSSKGLSNHYVNEPLTPGSTQPKTGRFSPLLPAAFWMPSVFLEKGQEKEWS